MKDMRVLPEVAGGPFHARGRRTGAGLRSPGQRRPTLPGPGLVLGLGLSLALPGVAAAQMTGTATTGNGTCSGMISNKTISGKTRLAVGNAESRYEFAPERAGAVFGMAECQCRSRDLFLRVYMDSAGTAPAIADPGTRMYVGNDDCDQQEKQSQPNYTCDQISTMNPPNNGGFQLSYTSFRSIGAIDISIPSEALTRPKPFGTTMPWSYACEPLAQQNYTAMVLLGPTSAPAVCKLPLTVKTQAATAPTIDGIDSGDGGLTVRWSVPELTSGIDYYQVLCRKRSQPQVPAMSQDYLNGTLYYFSACINGTLYRRPLAGSMNNTVIYPPDGGTTEVPDMASPEDLAGVDLAGVDLAGADLASTDLAGSTADMAAASDFPVDPRFICSPPVQATATGLDARIGGLENGQEYDIMVVSIDPYGNAAPSSVQRGMPQQTLHPLGGLCSGSDCPTGFGCQAVPGDPAAVAGFGAGGMVLLGAVVGLGLRLRRRRDERAAGGQS